MKEIFDQFRNLYENIQDQTPFKGEFPVTTALSDIDGIGLFATAEIPKGSVIAPARIGLLRTPAGRYTNHCLEPNAKMEKLPNLINLVALKDLQIGTEITVDYFDVVAT